MTSFFWRRLTQTLFIILGVTLLTFSLFHVVGGDPALQYAGKNASPEAVASLRKELGLDRPLALQYVYFLKQTVTWDWGHSWATKRPVTRLVADHVGASLSLTLPAYFFSVLIALVLALFMAYKKNSFWDHSLLLSCFTLMSFSFLVFIIYAQKILAFDYNFFPVYGWNPSWMQRWVYITLPCLIYVLASVAPKILLFRATLLNEVRQDYVRTAYAKGLSPIQIYGFHILKNAALPILALVTSQMPTLITGSLLLEAYFGIPGLGSLLLKSIQSSDLPVVKSITVMGSLIYIFFNFLNDLLAAFFDARVELQ